MIFQILKNDYSAQPYFWRIKAANGETLAHSEQYCSKQACKNAISIVKGNAADAEIEDYAQPSS